MAITIEDVAEKAGVSISTVSRVFNQSGRISEDTREEVLSVARELNYRPRKYTKKQRGENIGILINQFSLPILNNPFYSLILKGIEKELNKKNFHLVFKTLVGEKESDKKTVKSVLNDNQFKGLIVAGYGIEIDLIRKIKNSPLPVVLVDNDHWDEDIDCVLNDNISGARKVVKGLIARGHQRIGFIGGPFSHLSFEKRYMGYKMALKENNLEKENELIIFGDSSFQVEDGYESTKKLLKRVEKRPTALFAVNDITAVGAMKAVKEAGLSIPEDIAVAGFDDINMGRHVSPALTTVRVFKENMGIQAARRLLDLNKNVSKQPIKIVLSVKPVFRASTGD